MIKFERLNQNLISMKLLSINATDGASLLINIEHISAIVYTNGETSIKMSNGSTFSVEYSLPELIKEIENTKSIS